MFIGRLQIPIDLSKLLLSVTAHHAYQRDRHKKNEARQ